MRSCWVTWVGPECISCIPVRGRWRLTLHAQRRPCDHGTDLKLLAWKMGVMEPQVKEHQQPPEGGTGKS